MVLVWRAVFIEIHIQSIEGDDDPNNLGGRDGKYSIDGINDEYITFLFFILMAHLDMDRILD